MKKAPKKSRDVSVTIPLAKQLSDELDHQASRIGFEREAFLHRSLECAVTALRRYEGPVADTATR